MANLTNLVGLMNELIPAASQLAQSRAKVDELRKFCYIAEGPDDQIAVTHGINIGLPSAAAQSDRAAAISSTRADDVLTQTTSYTPFRTHAQFTDKELNRLVKTGELGEVLSDGLVKCWDKVFASVRTLLTGGLTATTIPDLSGTDYVAAEHTLGDSSVYDNSSTNALDTAALQTAVDKMVVEKDWSGVYTNARPSVLISSSAAKNHAAVASAYGSSALDANVGQGMGSVVLPGLGAFWAVSSGPSRHGLRIDFAGQGAFGKPGEPWVGEPFEDKASGKILIPYGCDFAAHFLTYMGIYISSGAGS